MTPPGAHTTRTACSYCGVGCGISVETRPDAGTGLPVIARVSGDRLHPTNFGRLCTKGATHADLMAADDGRLTTALVRRNGEMVSVTTDDATAEAGRRLRAIIDEHGPDAVALYVSGQMTIEAQYLANKLAKGFIRTVHIESNSRLCMASAGTGFKQSLGADGPPGSYADFDSADLFFVTGANMADCHPILFLRMADRMAKGAKLIVVDPRRTTTAEKADLFLQIKPGTDLALLNGLLHLLVESGAVDHEFIAAHTEGWETMPAFLADYPPAKVAEITGIAEADIRRAAAMIAEAGEWMSCWTMGLNQSTHGTWNTNAICNLHLATGAICRTGSGPMSLTGQPNAMGGREMGYMGPGLPGQRAVTSAEDRAFTEEQWELEPGTIRTDVGPGTIEMFRQLGAGDIKAVWIICTNPVASVANRQTVIDGLQAAELVITQDAYQDTATNAYADIVLPATLWAEAEGVMVNSERNLTLLQQSIPAAGDARPDWELLCNVARHMGFGDEFDYKSSEHVFAEIRQFTNRRTGYDISGVTYERLRETPLQWPCPPDSGDRNPIRYLNDGVSQDLFVGADGRRPRLAFPTPSRRAVFHARPHLDATELPDDDFPLVLNTGRLQHQWHTMTKTGKVEKLNKLTGKPFIEIHPTDAAGLGIADGASVEVSSRRGTAVLPAVLTDRVRPGNCFAPFHWNDQQGDQLTINAVTNDAVDPDSLQPEFKVCAVRLAPVAAKPAVAPVAAPATTGTHPLAAALGLTGPPALNDTEKVYLSGFFSGIGHSAGVPVLPVSAPVSRLVRLWVDGALAGAHSVSGPAAAIDVRPQPAPAPSGPLVLWASQTGTAEEFATGLAAKIAGARLQVLDDTALDEVAAAGEVLVVTSTFGDGGPPDNGADFWARLSAADAPDLSGLRYSVLGIGDRAYDNFCGYAKSLDGRFTELGATALLDRADCEAYDDEPIAQWSDAVVELAAAAPSAPTAPVAPAAPAKPAPRPAKPFTRNSPLPVPLCRNTLLTTGGTKEVRQIGFDLSGHDVSYGVGDALGVVVANCPETVSAWLAATGLSGDEVIEIDGGEAALRDALTTSYDICKVSPTLINFLAERSRAKVLRAPREERDRWLDGRTGLDLVEEFKVRAAPEEWRDALVRLAPRSYSISSSPLVSPDEVQLTVSVVRYEGARGGIRHGVASTYLADRAQTVPVFLQSAPHFRPPEDALTPMIMVGPGTGIAPFRGFLHERRALGHTGRNWLFFGDQHRAENYYYQDELEAFAADGLLTRLDTAFSRDQARRVYVQHRMREHGEILWRWLEDGAHFYVCGDAARMAKDVDVTLTNIIKAHGGMSESAAHEYKRELIADKRYVRDVY
ncbi:bifunctional nitrate reductase/sulfite reductase flavoprotein subunit alpha [Mycolicibacterium mucogenicum]|uniref:bifunctional nitrate reductase/sulfite reductase flavoprotein subunit alpha n=1 Tax=Mycolicibacterium mucogenicum TaxID=56689 RepID=UPI002269C9BB|nr:bifunctional nitrate reductase/sulfite reductase flavoprotein subunit alpha [Mycolicibacterium mucogenicum]MCX8556925.1 bifunctional nitrate reductase/sulfite reductase flavoprotein subunit alpha [Mycolicibacterium mucogenicum]